MLYNSHFLAFLPRFWCGIRVDDLNEVGSGGGVDGGEGSEGREAQR